MSPTPNTDERRLQADEIAGRLHRHPRISLQGIGSEQQLQRLRETLPLLVPFGKERYFGLLPILDWDHHLPTTNAVLRIYTYYAEETLRAGEAEMKARARVIQLRDRFPEFDVPDFSGLTADEAYEADIDSQGEVFRLRLTSSWRRDIDRASARLAVNIARQSQHFKTLLAEGRPHYLGDLEAVSWTPPCESNYEGWTIDCWYLLHLDAAVGKGRSFLVDLELEQVIGVREFVVRGG